MSPADPARATAMQRQIFNTIEFLPETTSRRPSVWSPLALVGLAMLAMPMARAGERVRVGLYQNSPKVGTSAKEQPEGIFVDLIEAIAKEEGWSIEYVPGTWGQGLDRVAAGEIDLMPDVAFSMEREKVYAFHREPVLSDWFQVYARRGSGIRSLVDLDGRKVSVLERSVQAETFGKLVREFDLKVTVVPFPDYENAFAAVERGEVDATITNRFYGASHLRGSQIEDTAIIFSPTRLFFAAPKTGDPALREAIDRHLVRYKQDPRSVYYRSLQRWTSEEVQFRLPAWLKAAGIIAAALLLGSLLWSTVLKRQVAVRTEELRKRNEENARLYEEVRRHAGDLEKRVAERTAELAVARDRAEESDRLKSAFLATMSHELRTPLNSVIGFTGILLMGLVGELNPEQKKQLVMVQDSANHLLELINDVLDISKIEAGQIELAREPFDMRSAIEKSVEKVAPLAEKKGLTVTAATAPSVGQFLGDRRRVEQVLINLLSNAVKFTERGGVRIESQAADGRLVIGVIDTGIGIRPENLGVLFKPFRQVDTGVARQYEGTGLGLSICKRLVEAMGGRIRVESEWGQGSRFICELPLERKPA